MLVLTEPTRSGRSGGAPGPQHRAERLDLDRIAERRAGAVRLDVVDVAPASTPRVGERARGSPPAWARPFGRGQPAAARRPG